MKINVKLTDLSDQSVLYQGQADLELTEKGGRIFDLEDENYKGRWKVLAVFWNTEQKTASASF